MLMGDAGYIVTDTLSMGDIGRDDWVLNTMSYRKVSLYSNSLVGSGFPSETSRPRLLGF